MGQQKPWTIHCIDWLLKFDHILRMKNVLPPSHETHQHIQELNMIIGFTSAKIFIEDRFNWILYKFWFQNWYFIGKFTPSNFGFEWTHSALGYKIYICIILDRFEKRKFGIESFFCNSPVENNLLVSRCVYCRGNCLMPDHRARTLNQILFPKKECKAGTAIRNVYLGFCSILSMLEVILSYTGEDFVWDARSCQIFLISCRPGSGI